MTRLARLIVKTGLVACKNKIVRYVFFVCGLVPRIVQYIKNSWMLAIFVEISRAEFEYPRLTQKKSYNNKVQNANQVWRFESHVRTITSLLEVIITVGLLCEMLELMHEK